MKQPGVNQEGIGLIELMVSSIISLILIAAIVALTVSSSAAYRTQTNHSRIQENGRFAVSLMSRDIRMAGYFGCLQSTAQVYNNLDVGTTGSIYDTTYSLEGYEQNDDEWLPSSANVATLNILPGTDAITIRFADISQSEQLLPGTYGPRSTILAANTKPEWDFELGNVVVLSDCDKADVFQVTNDPSNNALEHFSADSGSSGNTSPGNLTDSLGGETGSAYVASGIINGDAQVARLYAARYFVRLRDIDNPAAGVALYRNFITTEGNSFSQEVVEGVENLQLLYGVDTDGDGVSDGFRKADAVGGDLWNNVVSVQIGIVVRSSKEYGVLEEQQQAAGSEFASLNVIGESIAIGSTSRFQRDVYTQTVYLRN